MLEYKFTLTIIEVPEIVVPDEDEDAIEEIINSAPAYSKSATQGEKTLKSVKTAD